MRIKYEEKNKKFHRKEKKTKLNNLKSSNYEKKNKQFTRIKLYIYASRS